MPITRHQRNKELAESRPMHVLSSVSAGSSQEKPAPVTPSPAKKRRRRVSSPSSTSKIASAVAVKKEELKFPSTLTSIAVAAINPDQPFVDLQVPPAELRPSATLTTGQCFHWRAVEQISTADERASTNSKSPKKESAWGSHNASKLYSSDLLRVRHRLNEGIPHLTLDLYLSPIAEWVGTIRMAGGDSAVIAIQETPETTFFRPLTTTASVEDLSSALRDYFRLEDSLEDLYKSWSEADERLATIAKCIPGVRIVEQDPFECLISFICSSNNNIPRITKMVNAIRANYGEPLTIIGKETFYSFPSMERLLSHATDADFRNKCGLGYRSKYILETLQILKKNGGEAYLANLRTIQDPLDVQEKLCEFCGVGRKVADCVSLFSLRQDDAIPVDVHVWNIARRDYDPEHALDQVKSLTPTTYHQIGNLFRSRFCEKAGWAHSLLFVAELPSFRPVLPESMIQEMDQFKQEEKLKKQEATAAKKARMAREESP